MEIAELIKQVEAGEIELTYVDKAGFAPQPPNRSAWTKVEKFMPLPLNAHNA